MSFFRKSGELIGTVRISELPPFIGHSVSLSLFGVSNSAAPPPFDDAAPPESRRDEAQIAKKIDVEREDTTGSLEAGFRLRRPTGWYYLQLNVILYLKKGEKLYAQLEYFPFLKRPVEFPPGGQKIVLPVKWPSTPIDELPKYGTIKPGGGGQLY